MNRMHNCTNPYQGGYKRVLCVCSAGLLRSPTAAVVLSAEPFNFNTRCAGIDEGHALIKVDGVLLHWADEIVCMSQAQADSVQAMTVSCMTKKKIISLDIPDNFAYRDPELMQRIKDSYIEKTQYVTSKG